MTPAPQIDIPEVLESIGKYLAPHDLAQCVRVNRKWFSVLTPALWRTVRVFDFAFIMTWKTNIDGFEWVEPGPMICKYTHLIRSITTRTYKTLKDITSNCTQLTFLELDFKFVMTTHHHNHKIRAWNYHMLKNRQDPGAILTTLIRQNMGLKTVHICLGVEESFNTILDALSELQGLEELILSDYMLDQHLGDLQTILSKCRRLKRFAYGSTLDSMEGLFSSEEHLDKDFCQEMENFTMGDNSYELEQLILVHNIMGRRNIPAILELCPKLWSLRLPFLNIIDHGGIEHVVRHNCLYIQDLRVTVCNMAIHLLNDMLRSIERLTTLTLEYGTMTEDSLSTLIFHHGAHLRRLSLLRGMSTIERGQTIMQILQNCPNLESFVSDHPIHGSRLMGLSPRVLPPASGAILRSPLKLKRLSLCVVQEYSPSPSRIPGQRYPSIVSTPMAEYQWDVLDTFSRMTVLGCNLVFLELIQPPVTNQMERYDRIEWDEDLVRDFLRRARRLDGIVVEGVSFRLSSWE